VHHPNQWFQAKGTWWRVKDYFLFLASNAVIFIISAVSWQRCEQSSLWVISAVFGGQPQFRHRGLPVLPEAGVVSAGRQNKNRTLSLYKHIKTRCHERQVTFQKVTRQKSEQPLLMISSN